MAEPKIAELEPFALEFELGAYWFRRRGRPGEQASCDGSRASTEFTPQTFEIGEKERVALCRCRRFRDLPHCDGRHERLSHD